MRNNHFNIYFYILQYNPVYQSINIPVIDRYTSLIKSGLFTMENWWSKYTGS